MGSLQALLALMDEAYTGSVGGVEAESGDEGDCSSRDETDALFADLLKDENEGLAVSLIRKCLLYPQHPNFC